MRRGEELYLVGGQGWGSSKIVLVRTREEHTHSHMYQARYLVPGIDF